MENKTKFVEFSIARTLACSLGLKTMKEWRQWAKSEARPQNIPSEPWEAYQNRGWNGIGDFLGTGTIASQNRKFRPFKDARILARSLGFSRKEDWAKWSKTSERPDDIPACPNEVYANKGWKGWGDFLGTGFIAHKDRKYLPFPKARIITRLLGLQNKEDWAHWAKSTQRPENIPRSPRHIYIDEWRGWGDWLGTDKVANQNKVFRYFDKARFLSRSLNLKSQKEWRAWAKTSEKPEDIPSNPSTVYQEEWLGWGDWLGIASAWTRLTILAFVKSLFPILDQLEPAELFRIMQYNGLIAAGRNSSNSNTKFIEKIIQLPSLSKEEARQQLAQLIAEQKKIDDGSGIDQNFTKQDINTDFDNQQLPELKVSDPFIALDNVEELTPHADEDLVKFLIAKAVAKKWKYILSLPQKMQEKEALLVQSDNENTYSSRAKKVFSDECQGAIALELPPGYSFKKNGKIVLPNLMQRLVAFKVKNERTFGNWSGTGAGKTLAAILTSRVINAQFTLIVTLNSTLEGWCNEIKNAFPQSHVFFKKLPNKLNDFEGPLYLILNYEAFQQKDSVEYVHRLLNNNQIDFIVLDEIQNIKQRGSVATKRRELIGHLVSNARHENRDLCVLGMSATPVINSLDEAVSILSMIHGEYFCDLKTFPSLKNCIAIHEKMIIGGIRYIPDYKIVIDPEAPEIRGEFLLAKLKAIKRNEILKIERILLEAKLPMIHRYLKQGTIIYTHYIDGLVDDIKNYLKLMGHSHAEFTGNNKEGLKLFLNKQIDVLIASSTVGTGLDGLQYVCDQLIILSLPWTNAGYQQLLGRIYRQGSIFDKIRVIIPQVMLNHETEEWSYDKYRMQMIQAKRTLGDAVLDGVIPDDKILGPKAMLEESRSALQKIIARLEENGI